MTHEYTLPLPTPLITGWTPNSKSTIKARTIKMKIKVFLKNFTLNQEPLKKNTLDPVKKKINKLNFLRIRILER